MMRTLCCAATRATCVLLPFTSTIKLTGPVNFSRNVLGFNVHRALLIFIAYDERATGSNARKNHFQQIGKPDHRQS
ncbi:uncharacterized protein F5147DRAFT_702092 [Suillus discolor]|uniref:Uncharacterized protein n=1 Tax=Suillus discolor TaxID=1912936 RepID=A0A9P7F3P5_9AGAM|nr:uncharacterized protein F5147DRAFT_702092 [Suillus discolor]KAG2105824.1 hypothetical protein F5147DRAFT_702092 [Suillus discolor]